MVSGRPPLAESDMLPSRMRDQLMNEVSAVEDSEIDCDWGEERVRLSGREGVFGPG
jgi:hypothetical protein